MRKKVAGFLVATMLTVGAGPLLGTAGAHDPGDDRTDPVLCFVAAQAIITEALAEFRAGHLTPAELRTVLKGMSVFLGDCLTPTV